MRPIFMGFIALLALLGSTTAQAHHSGAMFDMMKCNEIAGTVRAFQFQFPHSWLWIMVPNAAGGADVYGFEAAAPVQMAEVDSRWQKDVFKKGDKITVKFSPLKDGRMGGALALVTLENGEVLHVASTACSGVVPPPQPQ